MDDRQPHSPGFGGHAVRKSCGEVESAMKTPA